MSGRSDAELRATPARVASWWVSAAVALAMASSTLAVWWGVRDDPSVLARYWDGPNYMYTARTFYRVPQDHPFVAIGLQPTEFATRLPAYPALVRAASWVTGGSYPRALLLATLLSAVAAAVLFHRMLAATGWVASPGFSALLFCVLPPRWLLYHSVGATEPLFLCAVFGAFLALARGRAAWVVACVGLASLTRITGVLLVPVFAAAFWLRGEPRRAALVPLALLGPLALFAAFAVLFGDFFAYFTVNSGERGLLAEPFAIVRWHAGRGDPLAAEFLIGLFLVHALGVIRLWPKREAFLYAAALFVFHCFVYHDDVSRYLLSVAPFTLLVAFDSTLSRPAARALLPLVALSSLVYAWGMLQGNLMAEDLYRVLLRALH
jgi:hypothetical protein